MKKERLIDALGEIDEKYIAEATEKRKFAYRNRVIAIAASLILVITATLVIGNIILNRDNIYSDPTVHNPDNGYDKLPSEDRFDRLVAGIGDYIERKEEAELDWDEDADAPGSSIEPAPSPEGGAEPSNPNGEYVEVTDNQVDGIIEGDLAKTTDKYIFRYGTKRIDNLTHGKSLRIYTIGGDISHLVSELLIPDFPNERYTIGAGEMYLSSDGRTVTIIKNYTDENWVNKTGIVSIDVSDVNNPVEKTRLSLDGRTDGDTRMINGKLYVATKVRYYYYNIDIEDSSTFIPGINRNGEEDVCDIDCVIFPDEITTVSYNYITVFNESDLSLVDEVAIMGNVGNAYFSDNHILLVYDYNKRTEVQKDVYEYSWASEITPVEFLNGALEAKKAFTVDGLTNNQYSFDEKDGYLRFVVTHYKRNGLWRREAENASLYIYDLKKEEIAYSVERFAPDGEGSVSERFEGDKLYVCTAEIVTFSDPVFFFDLSDYENITYVDTGYIDGFSTSLIDIGEGYLLGIGYTTVGNSTYTYSKIEVYKREGDKVVSVSEVIFDGEIATEYKSYLIDREKNLFGLPVECYFGLLSEHAPGKVGKDIYLIMQINDGQIEVICEMDRNPNNPGYSRAFYRDGYVYLTMDMSFHVKKLEVE